MTFPKILVTSFSTWKPEQLSNSSDDLLSEVYPLYSRRENLHLLRHLPVDFQQAPARVIQTMHGLNPDAIICCGMGESRSHLCIEDQAIINGQIRHTSVNVNWLIANLSTTQISHDAGQFVCNRLYFDILTYLDHSSRNVYHRECPCIFIHVPILTDFNRSCIIADFLTILNRMHRLATRRAVAVSSLSA